jgi:hypothetical protein
MSRIVWSFAADAALVVVFAAVGRASHREAVELPGVASTAWPFLAGLVIGWFVILAWRAPTRPWRTGLGVWAGTLVAGMLLRVAVGQGAALPFVIVAAVFLLVTLVGWRVIARMVGRGRGTSADGIHSPE